MVAYFQLKHSSVRLREPFTFSEAKKTIEGFADRFADTLKRQRPKKESVIFTLVTNRSFSGQLKDGIERIRSGGRATPALHRKLEKTTKLKGEQLCAFCQALSFMDGEADYISLKEKLRDEMGQCFAKPSLEHEVLAK